MHLQPDTLLQGRYRVVRLLAQGGMGAIYEAVDTRLGSTVALKQTLMSDPALREAFEREARLLAALHHPALPVVSDHFSEDGGQFLVMQFIPGDDLATLLKTRGAPFPPDQVLAWAGGLLDALGYLHSRTPPIIHRDIKPQNIKLAPHGGVILLDFGLAKGVAAGQTSPGPSLFGYTPQYAPIEQIQGAGTDARSDLYSLAATLAELLTGVPPPDALTRVAATVRGLADPLKPVLEVNPTVPATMSAAIHQSLALNPALRHQSALAMRADLLSAASASAAPPARALGLPRADSGAASQREPALQPVTGPTIVVDGTAGSPAAATGSTPAAGRSGTAISRYVALGGALIAAIVAFALGSLISRPQVPASSTPIILATGIASSGDGVFPTADPVARGDSRANPLSQGSTVTIDGWTVTVVEWVRGESAYEQLRKVNATNGAPPQGAEYLIVKLRAVATAPAPYPIGRGDVYIIGARDIAYTGYSAVPPEPGFGGDGEVRRNDVVEGWAAFLVGVDEPDLLFAAGNLITGEVRYAALTEGASFPLDLSLLEIEADRAGQDWREPVGRDKTVVTDDWEITLLELERGDVAWKRILAGNQFNDPPPAGMEYIAAYVRLRRIADDDNPDLISDSYFTGSVADEEVAQIAIVSPEPALNAQLFPGGVVEGWVVVTVPANNADARLVFQNNTVFFEPEDFNTRYFALE